jgi:hypothetical protein
MFGKRLLKNKKDKNGKTPLLPPDLPPRAPVKDDAIERNKALLTLVETSILTNASKYQERRSTFHRHILELNNEKGPDFPLDLVAEALKELEIQWEIRVQSESRVVDLLEETTNLVSKLYGKDSEQERAYYEEYKLKGEHSKRLFGRLQEEINAKEKLVSSLELENNELRASHDGELRTINERHSQIRQENRKNFEAERNAAIEYEKQELQKHLQQNYDIAARRTQDEYDETVNTLNEAKSRLEIDLAEWKNHFEMQRKVWHDDMEKERQTWKCKESDMKAEMTNETNRLRAKITSMQDYFDGHMLQVNAQHDDEIDQIRQQHELEKASWKKSNQDMQKYHESWKAQTEERHQKSIRALGLEHISMAEEKEETHKMVVNELNKTISEMRQNRMSENETIERQHQISTRDLRHKHQASTRETERVHGEFVDKLIHEREARESQLTGQISRMETDHASEQKKMRVEVEERKVQLNQQMAEQITKLKKAHEEATKRLRLNLEGLNSALLERDSFKPMDDGEMSAKFLDLSQDVTTLAQIGWTVDQKVFSSQVLQRMSPNKNLLKIQILQDMIWVTLFKFIFCSPFRMFGEEGRKLEDQWNSNGHTGECLDFCILEPDMLLTPTVLEDDAYTWPDPSVDTERWRYVTVKECREALTQALPSEWDPRARLKKGFKKSTDALKEELKSVLGSIAGLGRSDEQLVDKIAGKSARMWLEFGVQRCRVLVVMNGSNLAFAEDKVQRAKEGTWRLIVVPALKRIGNAKGLDLDTDHATSICEGEVFEASMRR